MMDLKKYKNCYVKLININNMAEIYGTLVDFDSKGNICLSRSIISVNKLIADPASTVNKIIKYNYAEREGSTISSILGPMYNNVNNDTIVWLNINNFAFIPIHDNASVLIEDAENSKKLISEWIDNVYSNYNEMYELLNNSEDENSESLNDTEKEKEK